MDIEGIRGQMPGLKHGVYLNTAGIGQSPVSVNKAVAEGYQQLRDGSVSTSDWYDAMTEAQDELPAGIAGFFGADAGEIALTMSTGEGYGMVLNGLRWQPGDEVLITNEEHPVPLEAAQGVADREGAIVKVVEIDQDKDLFLDRLAHSITPRTRLICFSHVTTDWGTRLPAREVCELARARGILTLWDGCQAIGQFPVDLHEIGCDFYATHCYKWMLSPMGTGFLYVRKGAQQVLKPLRRPHAPDGTARQYETGSPARALYLGLGAGLDFLAGIGGPRAIAAEAEPKAESLRERFDAIPGVRVIGSRRAETQTCTVAFAVEGMDGNEVSDALRNRWQIAQRATNINKPSGVRISVAFYTTDSELDALVDAVTTLAGESGNR